MNAIPDMFSRAVGGDRRSLARLFTRIERGAADLGAVMRLAYPMSGRAAVIGVTGPPGAGKSTLVDGLASIARAEGKTVGVLAVDPTSPFSGGAVLGDRVRMQRHHLDRGVFIRSLATRGAGGGLSSAVSAAVRLLDAVGKDIIMVETVGVGQTELDVMDVADIALVTLVPEAGDTVQAMKAGLLEIADAFVVNKADRDGAGRMASALRGIIALDPRAPHLRPAVLMTEARDGAGVGELYAHIQAHLAAAAESGRLARRRAERAKRESARLVSAEFAAALKTAQSSDDPRAADPLARVSSGDLDPRAAARLLLANGAVCGRAGVREKRERSEEIRESSEE